MFCSYVKAYSRRATCEYFTKAYHKALASYQKILEIEPENKDAAAGLRRVANVIEGNMNSGKVDPQQRARAMADPEIKAIMSDPNMQSVLRALETATPSAFQGYMQQLLNVRNKITQKRAVFQFGTELSDKEHENSGIGIRLK